MYDGVCCSIDERPNDEYILAECGKALALGMTPNQVLNYVMLRFIGRIDRWYVRCKIIDIQINWFSQGIVVGIGMDFPFEFRKG